MKLYFKRWLIPPSSRVEVCCANHSLLLRKFSGQWKCIPGIGGRQKNNPGSYAKYFEQRPSQGPQAPASTLHNKIAPYKKNHHEVNGSTGACSGEGVPGGGRARGPTPRCRSGTPGAAPPARPGGRAPRPPNYGPTQVGSKPGFFLKECPTPGGGK